MATLEQVREALRQVRDPELHRDLIDLDMIRDIAVRGDRVTVTVALTIPGCPLKSRIEEDVRAAVAALPDVSAVDVRLTHMSPAQRADLTARLQGGAGADGTFPAAAEKLAGTTVIGIASGKGGVGKSTVAINLAVVLGSRGHRTGILDCDAYGFSVPRLLNIAGRPTVIDEMIVPVPAWGVSVISMELFLQSNRPVVWRGPMLGKLLRQWFQRVYWGDLDFLILDLPPGTGDIALDLHEMLPSMEQIIVTTPDMTAAHVAFRAASMALQMNHRLIGVVENMSYIQKDPDAEPLRPFGDGGGHALAANLTVPLLARLPLDRKRDGTGIFADGTRALQGVFAIAAACEASRADHRSARGASRPSPSRE